MAEGYFDFVNGVSLDAGNLEDYCERQGIMRFASAAARDTALATLLTQGLRSFLKDKNVVQVYSGSAWSTIGPDSGALTAWTPTITQSGGVTCTINNAGYTRTGRWVQAWCKLTVTGSGTGANDIVIAGLPATAVAANVFCGTGSVFDTSAAADYYSLAFLFSTSTIRLKVLDGFFRSRAAGFYAGSFTMIAALAAGDEINLTIGYEASADG